jgi:P4 family phage/plasmid primase-like protien
MADKGFEEILRAARALFAPGEVVEVRVPKAGAAKTISGYFSDLERMAKAVAHLEAAGHPGVYWTINPVDPALLGRADHKLKSFAAYTTSDTDVVSRRWLPIDLDPKRPAGIASSEAEHQAALELAERIQAALAAEGWPEGIRADSGNGAHLLYALELPNDAASTELIKRCLHTLAERYSGEVEVDRTTFNASRIFKAYGTTARKGDGTADRPHRRSGLVSVPDAVVPISRELLLRLAGPAAPARGTQTRGTPKEFDLQAFLGRHGIQYRTPVSYQGGLKFVLEECPFNPEHKAPDAAVFERPDGLGFRCLHNSCQGRDWREFRELLEPGRRRQAAYQPPAPAPERELPRGAVEVEAAVDEAIAKKELDAALRLMPDIARLPGYVQVVIQAKLREAFKRGFPAREFARQLKELSERASAPPEEPPEEGESDGAGAVDLVHYPLTDSGNGERIVALHGRDLRFCTEFGKWLVWDGRRWLVDEAAQATQRAKEMARLLYEQAKGVLDTSLRDRLKEHARDSESQAAITAALKRAASEPGVPVAAVDLDRHPYLLNCLNGTVDVRTGQCLAFDRSYLITKLCHVSYEPAAECPRFLKFINWAMGETDAGEIPDSVDHMVEFLQKAFGYALTGDVGEKAAFVFYGRSGNNGKTTLLTLFEDLLTEYATRLDINTLMSAKFTDNNMRADLAKLRGVRYAITSEVSEDQKLSEHLLKYLTAGMGKITACKKYENPIEFESTAKIFMDVNYRPRVRGSDEAIWYRLKAIPFEARIEESDPAIDKWLKSKLLAESEGILAWAVAGAMRWSKNRSLGQPPEVAEANAAWRETDDPLKEFLEDCCETAAENWVRSSDLAAAYMAWCKQAGERFPLGRSNFGERLSMKGYRPNRSRRSDDGKQMRTWEGIGLRVFVTRDGVSDSFSVSGPADS